MRRMAMHRLQSVDVRDNHRLKSVPLVFQVSVVTAKSISRFCQFNQRRSNALA
jgi:hypothetical protein